jgi:PIN domain nuclease of toxin-antitoxin system
MTPPVYVVDTHALYWREFAPERLPPNVARVFEDVEAGRAVAVLLPIVLAEFYYVLRKAGFESDAPLYLQYVCEASAYRLEPLAWDDVRQLPSFPEVPEMHDRLIAVAAKRLGAVVLTRDPALHGSSQIHCMW